MVMPGNFPARREEKAFTTGKKCDIIFDENRISGNPRVPAAAGSKGNGVRIPDRTAAVWVSEAHKAIGNRREGAQAMSPSQKTCPWTKYQLLRSQERYVLRTAGRGCRRAGQRVHI